MGKPENPSKLVAIRDLAESHLFNIMFINSCESKGVIQMKSDYREKSLSRIISYLENFKPERGQDSHNLEIMKTCFRKFKGSQNFEFEWKNTEIYEHLIDLTSLVQNGANPNFKNFKIDGFTESVFSIEDWKLANQYKLNNYEMILVLFKIGYLEPVSGGKRPKKIPYNFLTARQLGSIYEGFLEYKIYVADTDVALINKKWQTANINSEKIRLLDVPTVKKGNLFFEQNDENKKDSGSYYTPDYIVQMIVSETLGPILKNLSAKEILKLKVCDPALGSGHFVNAALSYLANEYLNALDKEQNDDTTITLQDAKHTLLHNSIYGVDVNPRAVKLTKMSLWLESAKTGLALENLEEKIKLGDSVNTIDFNWKKEFKDVFIANDGFDAILMNPPYLGIKDNAHVIGYLRNLKEWASVSTNKYDLLYFFLARATQICRASGRIGAITTSYWPTADGADKLRIYLAENSSLEKCVFFNELKLFKSAKGQHNLVCYFSKNADLTEAVKVTNIKALKKGFVLNSMDENQLNKESTIGNIQIDSFLSSMTMSDLRFAEKKPWNLITESGSKSQSITDKMKNIKSTIVDHFCVHSGIETGSDRAGKKHLKLKARAKLDRPIKKYLDELNENNVAIGDGIFVLDKEELRNLSLSKEEKSEYIQPLIKNGDIKENLNFSFENSKYSLIHFSNGQLGASSRVAKHLSRFKPILENRYKYRTEDRLEWFDLHRPLNKALLECPKIINPYRAVRPIFSFCSKPSYALLDVFFIIPENDEANLMLALGLLNSAPVWFWLRKEGKNKGDVVELTSGPLSKIPFKNYAFNKRDIENVKKVSIEKIVVSNEVSQVQAALLITSLINTAQKENKKISDISDQLDILAACYFGLSKSELNVIQKELSTLLAIPNSSIDDDDDDEDAAIAS